MKRKGTTKIAAFLLSGMLLASGSTGILPGAKQLDILGTSMITASAEESSSFWEDTCYEYTYKNRFFTFQVNKGSKRATITHVRPKSSSMPSDVWFPPTVSITQTGKTEKFNVTDVGSHAINGSSSDVKRG